MEYEEIQTNNQILELINLAGRINSNVLYIADVNNSKIYGYLNCLE